MKRLLIAAILILTLALLGRAASPDARFLGYCIVLCGFAFGRRN